MHKHRPPFRRNLGVGLGAIGALALGLGVLPSAAADPGGPDNIILIIGDGMGYNHVDLASLYQDNSSNYQVSVDAETGAVEHLDGEPTQVYQDFAVQHPMSTYSVGGAYDPDLMWGDFEESVAADATDSAAAATAMATGVKTTNQAVGVGPDGQELPNVVERAQELDKATGVVTSVVFPHPTPAAFAIHHESRLDYLAVADLLVHDSGLNVIMGTGHPGYDDNGDAYDAPDYNYISEQTWTDLAEGRTPFELIEEREDFTSLISAEEPPSHIMGVAQAWTTLQEARGDGESEEPFTDPFIETVPELSEMTLGALNVLDSASAEGFFLAVESGAIDWSSELHAPARVIEEQIALNQTVEAAADWVEQNSSWEETMIVVTSDHEAGYLAGPDAGDEQGPQWTPMVGTEEGQMPEHSWHRPGHSNQLVPLYANGTGSAALGARAAGDDPVRGRYLDNTDIGQVILEELWQPAEEPTEPPTEEPTEGPTEEPTEEPTQEPTAQPTEEPTDSTPAPSPTEEQAPGSGGSDDADDEATSPDTTPDGALPSTGAPIGAVLVVAVALIGAGLVLTLRRRWSSN